MQRATFLQGLLATSTVTPAAPFAQPVLQQLTIGVNVPLSGTYAGFGREIVKGVTAAIDEANKFNATLTKAYGIRYFDDQNSGAIATSNVLVAAADPSIVGMVGDLTLDVTMTALPQYANAGFALVVPSVTADKLTQQGYHNVYRLPTNDSSEGRLFASAVLHGRAPMNVLGVIVDGDYGLEVARAFVAQAKAYKHTADLLTLESNADVPDSSAIIARHAPAYLFFAGRPDKLGPIAVALRAGGYTGQFGFSDSFYAADVPKTYGKALNGALVASAMPPLERVPSIVAYLQDFRNEVGAVTAFSAYGYAAAQLLIQASQRSNVTNRYQLLQQLQQGGTYALMVGQYSFNYAGDATLPNVYLFTLTAGGFTFYRPAFENGFVA
ncbi:MAG TPA: branched-chain amino acid ABC transporter substrate-binding protein [Alphaproteobacteria bacterium]|nr:branched-chain amino acid ABC transporter substrate-binding protein [Alphaproteobacteria bacterium]